MEVLSQFRGFFSTHVRAYPTQPGFFSTFSYDLERNRVTASMTRSSFIYAYWLRPSIVIRTKPREKHASSHSYLVAVGGDDHGGFIVLDFQR